MMKVADIRCNVIISLKIPFFVTQGHQAKLELVQITDYQIIMFVIMTTPSQTTKSCLGQLKIFLSMANVFSNRTFIKKHMELFCH